LVRPVLLVASTDDAAPRIVGAPYGTSIMSTATRLAPTRVPSQDRIFELVPSGTRVLITDVTWDVFEQIADSVPEGGHYRLAYDGKDIEMILSLGPFHERQRSFLESFIAIVAGELEIRRQPMGSTTWRRKDLERGIESDLCYFFDPVKMRIAAAADSDDVDDYPNPDLAVEVDISRPKLDRPEIYAALKVPELWRARDGSVSIEHLGPDGIYVPAVRSRYLPVSPEDVTRWVFTEDKSDVVVWEKRLRTRAQTACA
jgi:Uma2 family endonuclease